MVPSEQKEEQQEVTNSCFNSETISTKNSKKKKNNKKKKKELNKQTFIENIIENYKNLEHSIVKQLSLHNIAHGTTTGTLREDIWLQLFEQIIPKKFVIEHSVIVIDSFEKISKEIDIAIVDQNYTPYIFQYGRMKFIPIEAVAAVVECKSSKPKKKELQLWLEKISVLETSQQSIARMAAGMIIDGKSYSKRNNPTTSATQTATRPIRIFCGYKSNNVREFVIENFDFVLIAGGKYKKHGIELILKKEGLSNLKEWYQELNHYKKTQEEMEKDCFLGNDLVGTKENPISLEDYQIIHKGKEISLMSFNFLLNQILMLINNPILFPHRAYVNLFKGTNKENNQPSKNSEEEN